MATYSYSQNVTDALKENGLTRKVLWDCFGTFVIKHAALETIAANKGITFDAPVIIESDADKSIAIVMVKGYLNDKSEWTFGEATPKNSKNSYPYAMAEKRAKDRIILKLIGLHGEVYSEDEADKFKDEIAAQEKKDKKDAKVNTSVWGDVPKKKVDQSLKDLTALFATWTSETAKKTKVKKAKKDADDIFTWADKHGLVIVQDKYLNLFENKKAS